MERIRLSITCKACGEDVFSGYEVEQETWDDARQFDNYIACPDCGVEKLYIKEDYTPE